MQLMTVFDKYNRQIEAKMKLIRAVKILSYWSFKMMEWMNPCQKVPGHKVPGQKVPNLGNIGHLAPDHKVLGQKVLKIAA